MDYYQAAQNKNDAEDKFGTECVRIAEVRSPSLWNLSNRLEILCTAWYDVSKLEKERINHLDGIPQSD